MTITLIIIILTCLVSFPAFSNDKMKEDLLFWPFGIRHRNQYYRFLSGGVIHADTMHLLFNMVSLYSFGIALEKFLFPVLFAERTQALYTALYILALVASCIPDFFKYQNQSHYRALGASGAVSAVIFAAITIQPTMPIRFFFIPIDIPGWVCPITSPAGEAITSVIMPTSGAPSLAWCSPYSPPARFRR